jgi:putative zinc finger protein
MSETCSHSDAWLQLPWLANGRLAGAERMRVEEHVRGCGQCTREVALQRRLCEVLTEPERVTYAPGPSFRKLMDRIDGREPLTPAAPPPLSRLRALAATRSSAWRPPGLAWAASFLLFVGFLGLATTSYRWSQPLYHTHSNDPAPGAAAVLHVAFVNSLSIAEVGEALRSAGARVVEGPDSAGIVGVVPVAGSASAADTSTDLQALALRLRTDARVRWVQPLGRAGATEPPPHGPPQP